MESLKKEDLIKVTQKLRMPPAPNIRQMVRFAARINTTYGKAVELWEYHELWRYTYAGTNKEKQAAAHKSKQHKEWRCADCRGQITSGHYRCKKCEAERRKRAREGKEGNTCIGAAPLSDGGLHGA